MSFSTVSPSLPVSCFFLERVCVVFGATLPAQVKCLTDLPRPPGASSGFELPPTCQVPVFSPGSWGLALSSILAVAGAWQPVVVPNTWTEN